MLRPAIPLLLAVTALAGAATAQAQDRYGPPREAHALRMATAPAPLPLRTLSWAGKVEPRQPAAAEPAGGAAAAARRPAPTGRFPGVGGYAAPALIASVPAPPAAATLPQAAPQPAPLAFPPLNAAPSAPYAGPYAPAPPRAGVGAVSAPIYAPAPTSAPLRTVSAASAPLSADPLPAPTAGRYGYVGPGRSAPPATAPASEPAASGSAAAPSPVRTAAADGAAMPGPPRPPAYARAYVQPAGPAQPPFEGARRYSVHRQYGLEPDPVAVPPQFFAPGADMSAPETAPAMARMGPAASKAAVNAARMQANGG